MKLIKLIIIFLSLLTIKSTCEPQAAVFGSYINIFRENRRNEIKLKQQIADYKQKIRNLPNRHPGLLKYLKLSMKLILINFFYSHKVT